MSVLFSTELNISESTLRNLGVFNVFLDVDSHFFINIKRLQNTTTPEFMDGYDKVNQFFSDIGMLLKHSRGSTDPLYRKAFKAFNFPEVNGINLGFSSGTHGAGFGPTLREQIIKDACRIIQSGSEQPEIFHLVGLFEENVGPDRLSDMVARIIIDNIIAYTKRIYHELNVNTQTYPDYNFDDGILINPYKRAPLLLLPSELLHELPIARCWNDIDRVCRENEAIRLEINDAVGDAWSKMSVSAKKDYLRDWIFMDPERAARVIDSYKKVEIDLYNPLSNLDYLIGYMQNTFSTHSDCEATSIAAARKILDNYREWVEYHRGAIIIHEAGSRSKEKWVQSTIHAVALMFCKDNNWDLSPEVDSGRGPEDFKVSRGSDKTVVEVKLTSNAECVHGLEVQIEEYAKAESTENKLFVLVDTGKNSYRVKAVREKHAEMLRAGLNPAEVFVINAVPKDSASKYQPQTTPN